jgi:hypothetical protein
MSALAFIAANWALCALAFLLAGPIVAALICAALPPRLNLSRIVGPTYDHPGRDSDRQRGGTHTHTHRSNV